MCLPACTPVCVNLACLLFIASGEICHVSRLIALLNRKNASVLWKGLVLASVFFAFFFFFKQNAVSALVCFLISLCAGVCFYVTLLWCASMGVFRLWAEQAVCLLGKKSVFCVFGKRQDRKDTERERERERERGEGGEWGRERAREREGGRGRERHWNSFWICYFQHKLAQFSWPSSPPPPTHHHFFKNPNSSRQQNKGKTNQKKSVSLFQLVGKKS